MIKLIIISFIFLGLSSCATVAKDNRQPSQVKIETYSCTSSYGQFKFIPNSTGSHDLSKIFETYTADGLPTTGTKVLAKDLKCEFSEDGSHSLYCEGKSGKLTLIVKSVYKVEQVLKATTKKSEYNYTYQVVGNYWDNDLPQNKEDSFIVLPVQISELTCNF